ncbi:hypothetical protein Syun_021032 [Stephania yunnanensis]|uniref:Uncharacterized protein n=1 Tax=Stephania yunnanensis TaxID=152371 RepID=A0AAP0NQN2_9MAGN
MPPCRSDSTMPELHRHPCNCPSKLTSMLCELPCSHPSYGQTKWVKLHFVLSSFYFF